MKPALRFLCVSLTVSTVCADDAPLSISDQGRVKAFVVAKDEVLLKQPGKRETLGKLATRAANRAEMFRYTRRAARSGGVAPDLVLYPKGQEGVRELARVVRPRMKVVTRDGANIHRIAAAVGAVSSKAAPYGKNTYFLRFRDSAEVLEKLDAVRAVKEVLSADPELARKMVRRATTPTDPFFAYNAANGGYQWHLWNTGQNGGVAGVDVNIRDVWDNYTGSGVTVGIVDDGLQVDHPDLAANCNTAIDHSWNDGADGEDDPSPRDAGDSHGTAVGWVTAAVWNNDVGGTGAAPGASLVGLRLIAGFVGDAQEAEALGWRTDVVDISNNSWGPPDNRQDFADAGPQVKAALQTGCTNGRDGKGVIYMWAGGNGEDFLDNSNYDGYANSIYTVAVGAVTDIGTQSYFSERGSNILICAPSNGGRARQGITTTEPFDTYTNSFGGTSSA